MQYKNTQLGIAMLSVMGVVTLVLIFASVTQPTEPIGFAYLIVGLVSILFSALTIKVEDGEIKWFFGPKFWNKSIKISVCARDKNKMVLRAWNSVNLNRMVI